MWAQNILYNYLGLFIILVHVPHLFIIIYTTQTINYYKINCNQPPYNIYTTKYNSM